MNKLTKGVIAVLGLLCVILVYLVYTQLPQPTYKLNNPPKLLTQEVKAGEEVKWQNDICKLHDHEFASQRTFINLGTGRHYPTGDIGTKGTLKKGECRVSEVSQQVPKDLPAGAYSLLVEVVVQSNHFNTDKFEYTVGPFTIK